MADIQIIWKSLLSALEAELMPATINSWIKPMKPFRFDEASRVFTVIAPTHTAKETFVNRYEKTVSRFLQEYTGDERARVRAALQSEAEALAANPAAGARPGGQGSPRESNLNETYTFDSFVRGKSNELAFSACEYVAKSVANLNLEGPEALFERRNYNPLFLHGGVGLGKTHLMNSIGNYVLRIDPAANVIYTTAENLTNEFIESIRERKNQAFRDKYRSPDILLVDDIQFLTDKEGTQEEFFHTFNALYSANKHIVISSDRPPYELETFHERLQSRFDNGTMVDISAPDYETRIAILQKKLEYRGMSFNPEIISYIAKNISSNIRALEGALNTVVSFAKLGRMSLTLEFVEKALKEKITCQAKPEITIASIQEAVARRFGVTRDDLVSKRRTQNITYARHIAAYFCRKLLDLTHMQIGEAFGKRDHTSIIYACNKIAGEEETDAELRETLFALEKEIAGGFD